MSNKRPLKYCRLAAPIVALLVALAFAGCTNPVQPPPARGETGVVSLTIAAGQETARTIRPDQSVADDFERVDLIFTSHQGHPTVRETANIVGGAATVDVTLYEGTWTINAGAYTAGDDIPAATGYQNVTVTPGGITPATVRLSPAMTGTGTFAWDIDFPASFATARLEILYITGIERDTLYLAGGQDGNDPNPGQLEMPAGQYRVIVTMVGGDGQVMIQSEILHVFRGMESRFEESFGYGDFPGITLLEAVLAAWDATAGEWDFAGAGVVSRHFEMLGIHGVQWEFPAIVAWFNQLTTDSNVPTEMPGLRALTDAARIAIGNTQAFRDSALYQAGAIATISGWRQNASPIDHDWAADGTSVTVYVGDPDTPEVFAVTIDFGREIPVERPRPLSVTITPATTTVQVGGTRQFAAAILPAGLAQNITWSVIPEEAGSVNWNGNLTLTGATAGSTVTVRATATGYPDVYGEAAVNVVGYVAGRIDMFGTPSLSGGINLSWSIPSGADGFRVYADGTYIASTIGMWSNSLDLTTLTPPLNYGPYEFTVVAVHPSDPALDSLHSNSFVFVGTPFATPGNFNISGTMVGWWSVAGVAEYRVYADGTLIGTAGEWTTSFNLANASPALVDFPYDITLIASGRPGVRMDAPPTAPISFSPVTMAATTINAISVAALVQWQNITGHAGFRVYADGIERGVVTGQWATSFSLADANPPLENPPYEITVVTLGTPGLSAESPASAPFTFTPATLAAPISLTISGTSLSWNDVVGATGYRVYADGVPIGTTTGQWSTNFNLINADSVLAEVPNDLTVRAVGVPILVLDSPHSDAVAFTPATLAAPADLSISGTSLSWNSVTGATGYRVYADGTAIGTTTGQWSTSFNLINADLALVGFPYDLTVRTVGVPFLVLDSPRSDALVFDPAPPAAPTGLSISGTSLLWGTVTGATGYRVYADGTAIGTVTGQWVNNFNLANANPPLAAGTTELTVVALGLPNSAHSAPFGLTLVALPAPANVAVSGGNLTWATVPGNAGFRIYAEGEHIGTAGTTATSFNLANANPPLAVGTTELTVVAVGSFANRTVTSPHSDPATFALYEKEGITVDFADFRDMAQDLDIAGPTVSLWGPPVPVTVGNIPAGGTIRWFFAGREITGTAVTNGGATLYLGSRIHGEPLGIGTHFLTVEVTLGGRIYSRRITFTVER